MFLEWKVIEEDKKIMNKYIRISGGKLRGKLAKRLKSFSEREDWRVLYMKIFIREWSYARINLALWISLNYDIEWNVYYELGPF